MQRRRQWKCPLVEIIEDRVLLTAFLVDTLVDESDGNFEPGDLSLREAIEQANANPGADMIEFSPLLSDRTIVLGGSELVISDALTITGLGADRLTIDGNNKSRIFSIGNGVTTELSDLSLTGGNGRGATSNGWGGAILSEGDLTIDGVRIHHNTVSDGIPTGAGIRQSFGALVVTNSTIDHNEITTGTGRGGGIDFGGTTFHLVNSTIANNAAGTGGGVYVVNTSDTVIRNATIAFNSSPSYGGGLASLQGVGGQITLHNSLVIGNDGKDHYDNFYGSFLNAASSFNLVGTGITGGLQNGVNGNQTGLTAAAVLESTLTNNGGPTPTLALLPGSPAIDAGDNAACPAVD
ncbi:MAG: hypothetical protein KDA80_10335, partial [Planctomycetaceae bacterium]|nr:hypothetical protein [Planctomycetaceae bacterium]